MVDFLFIDGDHTYEGVKKDFEMYSPLVRREGSQPSTTYARTRRRRSARSAGFGMRLSGGTGTWR
jgi:hypothetical protein